MTVGSCQILLDAENEQSLSCSEVAEYASNLSVACSNSQVGTGGRVYPLPQGPSVGRTAIVLSPCLPEESNRAEHRICLDRARPFTDT